MPEDILARRRPTIDLEYYDAVAEGMRMAVTGGTCRRAALPDIEVAGKTGTAQNPHGKDHSAFMGVCHTMTLRLRLLCMSRNAGFGATYGVPIGSLVMEKYLTGKISEPRKYMEEQMLNSTIYYGTSKR